MYRVVGNFDGNLCVRDAVGGGRGGGDAHEVRGQCIC